MYRRLGLAVFAMVLAAYVGCGGPPPMEKVKEDPTIKRKRAPVPAEGKRAPDGKAEDPK